MEEKQNLLFHHHMRKIVDDGIYPSSPKYQQLLEDLWLKTEDEALAELEHLEKLQLQQAKL
jgi:hypothetical protein